VEAHQCLYLRAGPERCALAEQGSDTRSLMDKLDNFLLELYDSPLPVPDAARPGVLTSGMVKGTPNLNVYPSTSLKWTVATHWYSQP
jgi:hypothetical protein